MSYPAFRERYLAAMSLAQIEVLPNKASIPVVIGTGSIEQHGPHLPVAVDTLLAETFLTRSLSILPDDTPLLVGPLITFGKSNEHTGFPGTLAISKKTLRRQLMTIAQQLSLWGFKVMRVANFHGGNTSVIDYTLREIEDRFEISAQRLQPKFEMDLSEQEALYGFHAGEVETSWMLDIWPESVDMSKATCEYPASIDDSGELRPEDAPATFAWASCDVSKSGVMGDATKGTVEKGKRWMEVCCRALAEELLNIAK
ncbi:MAG: creatininase family protein [Opitutales bacterium]|nr:creatininase family protein [Opitutales bacterium]